MRSDLRTTRSSAPFPVLAPILLALLAGGGSAAAQECDDRARSWDNVLYTKDARHLAAGPGDSLWIATLGGGVSKMDAATETFAENARVADCLASNFPNDVAVASLTGDVWVAHDAGLSHLPGDAPPGSNWTVYDGTNSPLASSAQSVAAADDGTVWVGTFEQGAFHFDGSTWTQYEPSTSGISDTLVTSIEIDLGGDVWFGTFAGGVSRFDGSTWTVFNAANTEPQQGPGCNKSCQEILTCQPDRIGLISSYVDVLAVDPVSGDLWFRNRDDGPCDQNGITRFDGAEWNTFTQQNSGLISNVTDDATADGAGSTYFASPNGVSVFDGSSWTTFPAVGANSAQHLAPFVWFGTGDGLERFDGASFMPVVPETLGHHNVWNLDVDPGNGDVWIATNVALQRFDGTSIETFDQSNTPLGSQSFGDVLVASDGAVWAGLEPGGMARLQNGSWTEWTSGGGTICCSNFDVITEDLAGRIWAGWELGGLARFEGGTWTTLTTANTGLPSISIADMKHDGAGTIWFGTPQGLTRYDGTTWTSWTTLDGLISNSVRSVAPHPDGSVWVGTIAGASRFDGVTFTNYPDVAGDDYLLTMEVDAASNVWAGARNGGFARWNGTAWEPFGESDGVIYDRALSLARDPAGTVLLGTEFGISQFRGPHAGAPGIVPDGKSVLGAPLTVTKAAAGDVTLAWDPGCGPDPDDYAIYGGAIGDFAAPMPVACTTGRATELTFTPGGGGVWFVVTALNGSLEGGYGYDSSGNERGRSASPCAPDTIESVCP